jgi:hypothetical protein
MKVEYNEINIFAEFQLYNLIFAKNELLFDNIKTSVLLNLFWKLLEFNPDGPQTEEDDDDTFSKKRGSHFSSDSPKRINSDTHMIKYMGDGIGESDIEKQFEVLL